MVKKDGDSTTHQAKNIIYEGFSWDLSKNNGNLPWEYNDYNGHIILYNGIIVIMVFDLYDTMGMSGT
jgi:hypothetical protein